MANKKAAKVKEVKTRKPRAHKHNEPDTITLTPSSEPSSITVSKVKHGRKQRHLTTEERVDRLEALHAALVVKLRPHGIHLESHDEQEDASAE